jgi:hypothetical protein
MNIGMRVPICENRVANMWLGLELLFNNLGDFTKHLVSCETMISFLRG